MVGDREGFPKSQSTFTFGCTRKSMFLHSDFERNIPASSGYGDKGMILAKRHIIRVYLRLLTNQLYLNATGSLTKFVCPQCQLKHVKLSRAKQSYWCISPIMHAICNHPRHNSYWLTVNRIFVPASHTPTPLNVIEHQYILSPNKQ